MIATAVLTEQPHVIVLTEQEVITRVRLMACERRHAISYYPNAKGVAEKLNAIDEAISTLDSAEKCINVKQAIMKVLSVRATMHYIAPTATRKLHATWFTKVEKIMDGCREYLGWQKQ